MHLELPVISTQVTCLGFGLKLSQQEPQSVRESSAHSYEQALDLGVNGWMITNVPAYNHAVLIVAVKIFIEPVLETLRTHWGQCYKAFRCSN